MTYYPSGGPNWVLLLLIFCSNSFSDNLVSVEIAPKVFVFLANNYDFLKDPAQGRSNSGFIIGKSGVIVIDSGVSHQTGVTMINDIKTKTNLPIDLVILTHTDRNFVFGASAFRDLGIKIVAHPNTAKLIKERCPDCLKNLVLKHGGKMDNTRLIIPEPLSEQSVSLTTAGTKIDILHFGPAKTTGDLAILHPETGTLFAGGLLANKYIPDLKGASVKNWLRAIAQIQKLRVSQIVPGYGSIINDPSRLDTPRYILALREKVAEIYQNSKSLIDTINLARLPDFKHWHSYKNHHSKNVQSLYLEVELKDF